MVNKQHYNEEQLNEELKKYIYVRLKEYQSKLDREIKSYKHSEKWLPENLKSCEQNIEVFHHRVTFYQTQLDNLK